MGDGAERSVDQAAMAAGTSEPTSQDLFAAVKVGVRGM